MKKYTAVGGEVRAMMLGLTPLVEPLSIDEAFMDLSGTESLHRASPAGMLASRFPRHGCLTLTVVDIEEHTGMMTIGTKGHSHNLKETPLTTRIGPFDPNTVVEGNCRDLIPRLPDESIDVLVTSPPYWGQRMSNGTGTEEDPRDYLRFLTETFTAFLPKLKKFGLIWINLGDAYNTPCLSA